MKEEDFFHRIRNMLTVIKGNLDLIKSENISPADRKFLESARTGTDELKKTMDKFENAGSRDKH